MTAEPDSNNNNGNSLAEPLLSPAEQAEAAQTQQQAPQDGTAVTVKRDVPPASPQDEEGEHAAGDNGSNTELEPFSVKTEIFEMLHLALPLAVSFFCRMGMASTDR